MISVESMVMANASLFALVGSRITGFVVVSPFPGQNVSRTQRATLVIALAWIVMTFAPNQEAPTSFDLSLAGHAGIELACGLVVGIAFRLVFSGAEVLGGLLGQLTGLASPSVLNPTIDASDTVIGRIVSLAAMLVALSMGTHRVAIGALLESFRALPVGGAVNLDAPLLRFVDIGIDSFVLGVRLSTPIVGVALLVQLVLAMISRAAPSLQIFSVGFAILFISTTATIITSLGDLTSGMAAHFGTLTSTVDELLSALRL